MSNETKDFLRGLALIPLAYIVLWMICAL